MATNNNPHAQKGFTLIEMLITVGLFAIIVTIAMGSFTNAIRTQRQIASLLSAESNVSIALEQMTRAMRTGYLFCHDVGINTPSSSCNDVYNTALPTCQINNGAWTCPAVNFYDAVGQPTRYFLQNGALMESVNGLPALSVTGSNVSVKYLRFRMIGQTEGDYWPPRITIAIGLTPSSTDPAVSSNVFNLETTVSSRNIDCTPPDASGKVSC